MLVRPMKIYTRTGDDGTTGLFSGIRVAKNSARVEAYGAIDELNAALGLAAAAGPVGPVADWIREIQCMLFALGADVATPGTESGGRIVRIAPPQILRLEDGIDRMTGELPELKNFILPGGTPAAAHIHAARTICRRAERRALELAGQEPVNADAIVYLNRLSDFLFTLARWENSLRGTAETAWIPEPQN